MKKVLFTCISLIAFISSQAQAPQLLSYQSVIRNAAGTVVSGQPVGMRISILQGSGSGTAVYVETQTPTTNANGLASISIGNGIVVTGTLAGIDWAAGPYFIKTETDPTGGTNYTITGISQLQSVPYALYAASSSSVAGTQNYVSKFTSASTLGNSLIFDNDTIIGIGTASPSALLHVSGSQDASIALGGNNYNHQAFLAVTSANATSNQSQAVLAYATNSSIENHAIHGIANGTGSSYNVGAFFYANTTATVTGSNYGVFARAGNGTNNYGIYSTNLGTGYAGYFAGSLQVSGAISKGSGTFKIDHPLDPENKYLYHSFVESPDMMNIYNGNITTDANGDAVVALPDYFEALNQDFRYQLTVMGVFAQAIIAEKISGNKFRIKTDKPNVEVSWMVTGVRHDKYADAHRVVPEAEKEASFKGYYLHAAEWGKPVQKSIDFLTMPRSVQEEILRSGKK